MGQTVTVQIVFEAGSFLALVSVLGLLARLDRRLQSLLVEHNMLINDYCQRNNINVERLPTRLKPWG